MLSADRSLQVGIAFFGAGVAAVVARLGYVWSGSGNHFWDVWAVLAVVVGGLGLVIMVASWLMPSRESPPNQSQVGGDRSTNLQAARDINLGRDDRPGE
jgi:hypothetical protein